MTDKNTKKLLKKFGYLFEYDMRPEVIGTYIISFDCGDGWFDLLYNTFSQLSQGTIITTVKEKLGGLRIYTLGTTSKDHDILFKAEHDSFNICEECGGKGKRYNDGWIRALCSHHYKEWKKR